MSKYRPKCLLLVCFNGNIWTYLNICLTNTENWKLVLLAICDYEFKGLLLFQSIIHFLPLSIFIWANKQIKYFKHMLYHMKLKTGLHIKFWNSIFSIQVFRHCIWDNQHSCYYPWDDCPLYCSSHHSKCKYCDWHVYMSPNAIKCMGST